MTEKVAANPAMHLLEAKNPSKTQGITKNHLKSFKINVIHRSPIIAKANKSK